MTFCRSLTLIFKPNYKIPTFFSFFPVARHQRGIVPEVISIISPNFYVSQRGGMILRKPGQLRLLPRGRGWWRLKKLWKWKTKTRKVFVSFLSALVLFLPYQVVFTCCTACLIPSLSSDFYLLHCLSYSFLIKWFLLVALLVLFLPFQVVFTCCTACLITSVSSDFYLLSVWLLQMGVRTRWMVIHLQRSSWPKLWKTYRQVN